MQADGLIHLKSPFTVSETTERLERLLVAKQLTLFCKIDHSAEAEKVGLKMLPTKLLLFGSPSSGTPLMLASPSIAIDLPLKALVWEDNTGQVRVSYNDPVYLQKRHSVPAELVKNIAGIGPLLQSLVAPA
jgi:uncharacterized protein (DUF302 family)